MKTLITIIVFFLMSLTLIGKPSDNYISKQTGNWNTKSTWVGNNIPNDKNNMVVNIISPHTITLNTNLNLNNNITINVEDGAFLIINGNVDIGNNNQHPFTFTINGTAEITGNLTGVGSVSGGGELTVGGTIGGNMSTGDFAGDLIGTNRTSPTNPTWEIINDGVGNFSVKLNWEFSNKNTLSSFIIKKDDSIIGNTTNLTYTDSDNLSGESTPVYKIYAQYTDSVLSEPLIISFMDSPLPIELISFISYEKENSIELEWITATEINNDYFTVEKSSDLQNWETLTYVQGAGNSNSILKYSYIDNEPKQGISYYRLTQTDYDGQFEIFNPISVNFNNLQNDKYNNIKVYDLSGNLIESINVDENYILKKYNKIVIVMYYFNNDPIKSMKIL